MKTKLYVYFDMAEYTGGMRIYSQDMSCIDRLFFLGELEIDNPFNKPDTSVINNVKIEAINKEIKEHKAQINLLENKVKDLICIENKEN